MDKGQEIPELYDRIAELEKALLEAHALAAKWVWKCEHGFARSTETYRECKAFLETVRRVMESKTSDGAQGGEKT